MIGLEEDDEDGRALLLLLPLPPLLSNSVPLVVEGLACIVAPPLARCVASDDGATRRLPPAEPGRLDLHRLNAIRGPASKKKRDESSRGRVSDVVACTKSANNRGTQLGGRAEGRTEYFASSPFWHGRQRPHQKPKRRERKGPFVSFVSLCFPGGKIDNRALPGILYGGGEVTRISGSQKTSKKRAQRRRSGPIDSKRDPFATFLVCSLL